MTRITRRGFTLVEVVGLLPLLLLLIGVSAGITVRCLKMYGEENRVLDEYAQWHDVVRRVQSDVRSAAQAEVEQAERMTRLLLTGSAGEVVYESGSGFVRRKATNGDDPSTSVSWQFDRVTIGWELERTPAGKSIAWTVVSVQTPAPLGPDIPRMLSTAAVVAGGGVR